MRLIFAILFSLSALADTIAHAAHTEAQLLLSATTARPGDTIWAGVDLKMEPGWHTYWKNPGAAGEATEIKWQLPPGVTAGEIHWPLPQKLPPADITTYGYEDEVMLLVPLTIGTNFSATSGPLNLKAKVSWLECNESCIPASAEVQTTLALGSATQPSVDAPLIQSWQAKVPAAAGTFSAQAWWDKSAAGDQRTLNLQWSGQTNSADFFPTAYSDFEIQSATELLSAPAGEIHLRKVVKKFSGDWPKEISGVFISATGTNESKVAIGAAPAASAMPADASNTSPSASPSLWRMLIYAFIGGLILNIMPCVLPVIALKILGFVSEAKSSPGRVRMLGLVYAFGVIVSFMVLAAIVIGVKGSGIIPAWGMQFGSPIFIVCLATLVTLVALNLFGVFEVVLGGRALNTAGELAARHGAGGAFFNGVLATTLATPCTAPFLAPALGFAFVQSTGVIILIFFAVGLGLASPYILLSWHPAWLKFLPKPGAWMEKFKIAMGFPMLATVMWLFYIAASSYGKNVAWLGGFLVVVALAAWIFGEFIQRGRQRKTLAAILVLILLAGGYVFILEKELDWRAPYVASPTNGSLQESANGIDWQRWSPAAVAAAQSAGKPVLVDFTADWCLTCQVNKKTSIEIDSVREKLKSLGAVALLGDYTHFATNITTELQHFNRAGVPLVLVYPKNPDTQPIVLPEILTPGIVLDALDRAVK
jgi:thiol:disulfide interchange protein DsbD